MSNATKKPAPSPYIITPTFTGTGESYRKVWHVSRNGVFVAQYSVLRAALDIYPGAKVEE